MVLGSLFFVCCVLICAWKGVEGHYDHCSATCFCPRTSWPPNKQYSCGDDMCKCSDDHADCSNEKPLTYIPRLPSSVWSLDFSGNTLVSRDLDADFFVNASRITHLTLSSNLLTDIPPIALHWMTNLTCLNLDRNLNLNNSGFLTVFSIPTLRQLSLGNTPFFDFLRWDMLSEVNNSNVEVLRLSSIFLPNTSPPRIEVDLSNLCSLKRLTELDLSSCNIEATSFYNTSLSRSGCFSQLKKLDIRDNKLGSVMRTCLSGSVVPIFPVLQHLNMSQNKIFDAIKPLCLPKVKVLDISQNVFSHFTEPVITFAGSLTPNVVTLLLNDQETSTGFIGEMAFSHRWLNTLSLAGLKINFKDVNSVAGKAFGGNKSLQKLILDGNSFLYVDDERFLELFGGLTSLVFLSMQSCQLGDVSMTMFATFPRLSELFLRDNKIVTIPDASFDSLKQLHFLDVSWNQISVVTDRTFSPDTRHRLSAVYLGNNPFVCSCQLLWFRGWLLASNKSFFSPTGSYTGSYSCKNLQKTSLEAFHMETQPCLLSREVNTQIIMTCSIVIIALTLISLLLRYRWHIRLLFYEAFRSRDGVRRQRLLANDFDYDIFVSYAGEQLPWVQQRLLPCLEDQLGFKLCVHERDFIPGKNIVDNIVDCVQSSKKIMMVFSRDFVSSQWCQFELAYCLRHVMDYNDDLIIVCVDDVTSHKPTSAMMAVLKTTTYIQWMDSEDAVQSFWGRLRLALNDIAEPTDQLV